eukprot:TRINITY_DN1229_c0_g1_i3.p1 TRINITY_DN1229_c0_g1~~TRINITY_DN1229_c0_g1_i3.p1  ORF type:complete len:559 (+),score=101.34 TRINITY_DN1229_c0_g1_i3:217-1893(+)
MIDKIIHLKMKDIVNFLVRSQIFMKRDQKNIISLKKHKKLNGLSSYDIRLNDSYKAIFDIDNLIVQSENSSLYGSANGTSNKSIVVGNIKESFKVQVQQIELQNLSDSKMQAQNHSQLDDFKIKNIQNQQIGLTESQLNKNFASSKFIETQKKELVSKQFSTINNCIPQAQAMQQLETNLSIPQRQSSNSQMSRSTIAQEQQPQQPQQEPQQELQEVQEVQQHEEQEVQKEPQQELHEVQEVQQHEVQEVQKEPQQEPQQELQPQQQQQQQSDMEECSQKEQVVKTENIQESSMAASKDEKLSTSQIKIYTSQSNLPAQQEQPIKQKEQQSNKETKKPKFAELVKNLVLQDSAFRMSEQPQQQSQQQNQEEPFRPKSQEISVEVNTKEQQPQQKKLKFTDLLKQQIIQLSQQQNTLKQPLILNEQPPIEESKQSPIVEVQQERTSVTKQQDAPTSKKSIGFMDILRNELRVSISDNRSSNCSQEQQQKNNLTEQQFQSQQSQQSQQHSSQRTSLTTNITQNKILQEFIKQAIVFSNKEEKQQKLQHMESYFKNQSFIL